MRVKKPVVVHFVGASGSGKTTLIEKLIRVLRKRGLAVGAVKHAHHGFEMDRPGKDSYRFRAAGANAVAVVSPRETALIFDTPYPAFPEDLLKSVDKGLDLILVEGFGDTRGWRFHVQSDAVNTSAKIPKKGQGFLGVISRKAANKPSGVADLLIYKFRLRRSKA